MSTNKAPRKRRAYTSEFKQQIVDLYRSGRRKCDILREYDLSSSLLDKWIAQAANSGSFKEKDNRTPEQEELLQLRKRNRDLEMEIDLLYPGGHEQQAALILGRR